MDSTRRRSLLRSLLGGTTIGLAGCSLLNSNSQQTDSDPPQEPTDETRTGTVQPEQPTETTTTEPERPYISSKLVPDDGDSRDGFGASTSLSGNTAIVTAPGDEDPNGVSAGSVYVFERVDDSWSQQVKLFPDDGDDRDGFGSAVSFENNTAVIAAGGDEDPNGEGVDSGSVYVYTRSSGSWAREAKLSVEPTGTGNGFGYAVSLSNDTIVVGAYVENNSNGPSAGAAYVFERTNNSWTQSTKLTAEDGDRGDFFGKSVAIHDDTAAIGATNDENTNGDDAGSVYIFERDGESWTQVDKLTSEDWDSGDMAGRSLALAGDTLMVGVDRAAEPYGIFGGLVSVFERTDGSWSERSKLLAEDGDDRDQFGKSMSLMGDTAIVGSYRDEDPGGKFAGSAYVFERTGGSWEQKSKLWPENADEQDYFGTSTALGDETALVGASWDEDPNGEYAGSAYAIKL